jgi:NAD(P)-dependent dehydrogenase (short-subunit alcohol dehydrogenase family)
MCAPYSETKQGFEVQFAVCLHTFPHLSFLHLKIILTAPKVNYISHFLLTQLLLPTLLSTATTSSPGTVRIVNVSSGGHAKLAPKAGIAFDDTNLKNASTWTRYGQSKLANVLHAKELARRYGEQRIWAASLHPGTVKTFVSLSP